jgi:hypothetical protein
VALALTRAVRRTGLPTVVIIDALYRRWIFHLAWAMIAAQMPCRRRISRK